MMSNIDYILKVVSSVGPTNSFTDLFFPNYKVPFDNALITVRSSRNSLTYWIPGKLVKFARDESIFTDNYEHGFSLSSKQINSHVDQLNSIHGLTKDYEKDYEKVTFFTAFFPDSDDNQLKQDIYYVNIIFE